MIFNDDLHRRFETIYLDYLRKVVPSIFEKFDDVNNEDKFKAYTFKRNEHYYYHSTDYYERTIVNMCFKSYKWLYQTCFDTDDIYCQGDFNFYRADLKNFGKNKDYHIHHGISKKFMEKFIRLVHNIKYEEKYDPSKYISPIAINEKLHYMYHVSDTPFSNQDKFWFNRDDDNFAFCFVLYIIEMFGTSSINFDNDVIFAALKQDEPCTILVKYHGEKRADMQEYSKMIGKTLSGYNPEIHRIVVVDINKVDIEVYNKEVHIHVNYENLNKS